MLFPSRMGKLADLERSKGWVDAAAAAMMAMMTIYGKKAEADITISLLRSLVTGVIHVSEGRKGWMSLFTMSHLHYQLVPRPWAPRDS